MASQLTAEQKRAKGYVSCGMVGSVEVFLPLNVTRNANRIKDAKVRAQFLADSKQEYLDREAKRQAGGETTGPIEFEATPNGRLLIKLTGTRRWAFFSKEQFMQLLSPAVVKKGLAFAKTLPDSVQGELEVESA